LDENNIAEPQVIRGDCREVLKSFESESVDLIVADPPYNVGKDYGNNSDSQSKVEYLQFSRQWLNEANRVLKKNGSIYVFMGFRFISHLYLILEEELEMNFCGWITWHYTQGLGKKKGFSPRHDDILYFSKGDSPTFNLDSVRVPQKFYRSINNMRGANPGDVWEFSHIHYCQAGRMEHPTQKPEGLIERMVLASSNENETVVDPFAGSGTTLRVCQQLSRKSVGIELSSDYVALIRERLAAKFSGFDSIDPRMKRIPNDLNDLKIREEYKANHKAWFLSHHETEIEDFERDFRERYPDTRTPDQMLFEFDDEKPARKRGVKQRNKE
jgi:site-specific DNA-methyltransferase (adenine-specific)